MLMDMPNRKLSLDNNKSMWKQNDRESKLQSGADMGGGSDFVDLGGFLINSNIT